MEIDIELNFKFLEQSEKIQVLDVGSCFNPFGQFSRFKSTAIDISPADESVMKCDFINVETSNEKEFAEKDEVKSLPKNFYDAVIFSLLLEYLPTPRLRYKACEKARKVLKTNSGLLIIITPDSCHQGRNLNVIRSWKICLATLGFTRIYYEKREHIHCMAFLKLDQNLLGDLCVLEAKKEAEKLGTPYETIESIEDLMIIPQDSNVENVNCPTPEPLNEEEVLELFETLPTEL